MTLLVKAPTQMYVEEGTKGGRKEKFCWSRRENCLKSYYLQVGVVWPWSNPKNESQQPHVPTQFAHIKRGARDTLRWAAPWPAPKQNGPCGPEYLYTVFIS
jgi:hypothetical protein